MATPRRCACRSSRFSCPWSRWPCPSGWCDGIGEAPMLEVDVAVRRGDFRIEAAFASDAPIVALFGRSGSGKTTLVNAIAGTVRPERGRIVIASRALFDSARGIDLAPEHRRVGYVFQDALLFPHMSVRANLAFGETLTPPAERV